MPISTGLSLAKHLRWPRRQWARSVCQPRSASMMASTSSVHPLTRWAYLGSSLTIPWYSCSEMVTHEIRRQWFRNLLSQLCELSLVRHGVQFRELPHIYSDSWRQCCTACLPPLIVELPRILSPRILSPFISIHSGSLWICFIYIDTQGYSVDMLCVSDHMPYIFLTYSIYIPYIYILAMF